jgi:tetratricopeptide (TPR) repeat protein
LRGWGLRTFLAALLLFWMASLAADWYYPAIDERCRFGLREDSLEFAHDAAIFAGRPGLPDRSLVFHLGQASVYGFHNAPARKTYLDGRLEMPDRKTFETYLAIQDRLDRHDARWEGPVREMGYPLLLVGHQDRHAAEALLLTHSEWRCIYFDAIASVFVHKSHAVSESDFPTVDFAARHFREAGRNSIPAIRGSAAQEAQGLYNLSKELPGPAETIGQKRLPFLLMAIERSHAALSEEPDRANTWFVLGGCYWYLNPDLHSRAPDPDSEWVLEEAIYWAKASYALQRAIRAEPRHQFARRALFDSYMARRMFDAAAEAGEAWLRLDRFATPREREQIGELADAAEKLGVPAPDAGRIPEQVFDLLRENRPAAAARLVEQAQDASNWIWPFADRVASLYMHLGRPVEARRVWDHARECPSEALRKARLAATHWVEGDLEGAAHLFHLAAEVDPKRVEAWWGLAMVRAQQGNAVAARDACRAGLLGVANPRQRADLETLLKLVSPYASQP